MNIWSKGFVLEKGSLCNKCVITILLVNEKGSAFELLINSEQNSLTQISMF